MVEYGGMQSVIDWKKTTELLPEKMVGDYLASLSGLYLSLIQTPRIGGTGGIGQNGTTVMKETLKAVENKW